MSHEGELIRAGFVRTTSDPPALRAPGNAAPQALAQQDGQQLVQWLTVQAEDMAGTLQHGVRTLISRTCNPDTRPPGQADEFARLRETAASTKAKQSRYETNVADSNVCD